MPWLPAKEMKVYNMDNRSVIPQDTGKNIQQERWVNLPPDGLPEQLSDGQLRMEAVNALKGNVSVPADCIKIFVQDGVIILSGELDWEYQKFAAVQAVRYIAGAVAINNRITVKPKLHTRW